MTLPPELDAIWRGNPLPPESLILATYNAGLARAEREREDLGDRLASLSAALCSAKYVIKQIGHERDALKKQVAAMKGSWKRWCDERALERYEAMKAERDKYRELAGQGERIERQLRVELLKASLEQGTILAE
jgi:hypothetical protein